MKNEQPVSFSGNIPGNYDAFLRSIYFEPYAWEVAAKIKMLNPATLLELACGTGILTRQLALLKPSVEITATDISETMLQEAKRLVSSPQIHWAMADATKLNYDKESFDCVAAQFGVMFFEQRVKVFQAINQILKKKGAFVFTTWNSLHANPIAAITHQLMFEFFPVDTPGFYEIPFSYHDTNKIKEDLDAAGFHHVSIELLKKNGYASSAKNAAKGLIEGTPAYSAIMKRAPAFIEPMKIRLEEEVQKQFGAKDLSIPLEAYLVIAQN